MALRDVTRAGVLKAIEEYDELGRSAFLSKYAFGPVLQYTLVYKRKPYDSKAIVGVAHGFDHPGLGQLSSEAFSGGKSAAAKVLEDLDFTIDRHWPPDRVELPVQAWVGPSNKDWRAARRLGGRGRRVLGLCA